MSDFDFLKEIPLFINLDDDDLSKIMRLVSEDTYKAETELFKQGDPGNAFFIIKDGSVAILKEIDGKEVKVATLKRGDFFGETALIDGEPRTATVAFEQPTVLYKIMKDDFDYLMRVNLSISLKIMKEANRRLREEQKKVLQIDEMSKREGRVITFFSTKGGTGKSMIAVNMAIALKKVNPSKEVAILDVDLQFGDAALYMNIVPKKCVVDIVEADEDLPPEGLRDRMYEHDSGVWLLPAPLKPESAEKVTRQHIAKIIEVAKKCFDYVVVDTSAYFQDVTIQVMDLADIIYLITTLDIASIKNAKQSLDVMQTLNYGSAKVKILVNRDSEKLQIRPENVESSLANKLSCVIPEDPDNVLTSLNAGRPVLTMSETSPISKKFMELASDASGAAVTTESPGLFEKIKEIYGSISKWKKVTEMHPEYSQAYYALGLAYKTKGLLNEAIIEYKKAIELNPDYPDAHFWLGKAYVHKGMYQDAVKSFRNAVEINPQYKEALTALGTSLTEVGEAEEAIKILESAREIKRGNNEFPDIHLSLGKALFQKGAFKKAEEELNTAIELNPNYLDAYITLGDILEGSGQLEGAVTNYQKAMELAQDKDQEIKLRIKDKLMKAGSGKAKVEAS